MSLLGAFDSACRRVSCRMRGASSRVAVFVAFVALWGGVVPQAFAQGLEVDEYQQKASLICNFLRQCRWPERRFAAADSPFIVGVYGSDRISQYLRENTQNRLIQGRRVIVRNVAARDELAMCHLVFVSHSERDRLRPVLGETRRENVLTVGESDNFLASGGVIQFVSNGGQIRYRISLEAARRERIEPGGFVLRMALPQSSLKPSEARRLAETP